MSEDIANYELEYSDSEVDNQQPEDTQIVEEIPTAKTKPKKRVLTAKQLETSRRNLELARQKRAQMKVVKQQQPQPVKPPQNVVDYDSYSDSDYSDDDEPPRRKNARQPKSKSYKDDDKPRLSKSEMKIMEKMDKIERIIDQWDKAKKKSKQHVHKTVIVQPPVHQYGKSSNENAELVKKTLKDKLDLF